MAKKAKKPTPEQLGKMLKDIYESGYLDRTTAYKMSFIKGILAGFGGVIGATIVVTILLWILSIFGRIPFVGGFVDDVKNTVESSQQ